MASGIRVGGVWKEIDQPHARIGGVWKAADKIHARIGGVWKVVWEASVAATVTLTNATNIAFSFGSDSYAYFYWNTDGTVDQKDNNAAAQQINSGTDWIIPNASASSSYRIKYSSLSGDTGFFGVGGNLSTSYTAMSVNNSAYVYDNTVTAVIKSCNFTVHIDDGTTEQDTGAYILTANREDF